MTEGASERETPGPRPGPRPGPPSPRPGTPQTAPVDDDAPDPRVQAVLADLEKLAELPVGEHLAVYERVHAKLREVLQTAGQRPPETP